MGGMGRHYYFTIDLMPIYLYLIIIYQPSLLFL